MEQQAGTAVQQHKAPPRGRHDDPVRLQLRSELAVPRLPHGVRPRPRGVLTPRSMWRTSVASSRKHSSGFACTPTSVRVKLFGKESILDVRNAFIHAGASSPAMSHASSWASSQRQSPRYLQPIGNVRGSPRVGGWRSGEPSPSSRAPLHTLSSAERNIADIDSRLHALQDFLRAAAASSRPRGR